MVSAPTAQRVDLGSIPSFGHFRIGQFFRENRMLYNQQKRLLHIRRRGTSTNFRSGHRAMTARNNKATSRDSKLSSRKCCQWHKGDQTNEPKSPARPAEAWPWMTGPGNARAPHLGGGHYVLRVPLSTIRELGRDYREGGFRARRHSPFTRA